MKKRVEVGARGVGKGRRGGPGPRAVTAAEEEGINMKRVGVGARGARGAGKRGGPGPRAVTEG